MSDNYSYLVIPFEEFEKRINDAINAGNELKKVQRSQDGLQEFKQSVEQWTTYTQDNLQASFADARNIFTQWYKDTAKRHNKNYGMYWQEFNDLKDEVLIKCYTLGYILRTISVCDFIRDKEHTELKKGLSVNEKASLLLEKLYHLDNERNHLARMLLVGSGVELKKPNEAIEIANYLMEKGLVDISHYAESNDLWVTISTDGKVLYEEQTRKAATTPTTSVPKSLSDMTAIFIVHGHNNEMKEAVARVVSRIGYEEIILHEQASKGMTVIEKFKEHSGRAQFAIVLLSADDLAYPKKDDASTAKLRPRQNVVFELGYFVGKLGSDRVFCLYETFDDFELHSDFAGVVLTPFDSKGAWKTDLGRELQALGAVIDWNLLMK